MNPIVKSIARPVYYKAQKNSLGKKSINLIETYQKLNRKFSGPKETGLFLAKNINKIYFTSAKKNKGSQIKGLLEKVEINIPKNGFIFFLDEFKKLSEDGSVIDNISIDYSRVIDYSLSDYNKIYFDPKDSSNENKKLLNSRYIKNQRDMLEGIELFIQRIIKSLNRSSRQDKDKFILFFENILNKKAEHFEEGLQRILFFNQLLWQTGHELNGLGRLDKILEESFYNDLNNGILTKEEAFGIIKDFLNTLHSYYWFKSAALMGDTGQVIILGGKELDGTYFSNDLTYMFIDAINNLQLPDPKALLRVSEQTPRDLIELSLKTINSGCGSPLLSNDDVVIPKMIEFGYDMEDAYNYVVSACWEPSAVGKGLEQNNMNFISYLKPLVDLFDNGSKELLDSITNLDSLMDIYKRYLKKDALKIIEILDSAEFNEDPLLSMFIDDCNEKGIDISQGGAKYNHYGITTVSLANTVNSLYNIKELVFEKKKYTLSELNALRKDNFKDSSIIEELKNNPIHFGKEDEDILWLSNEIINCLDDCFKDYRNKFGGRIKFGLSAPSYISAGQEISASFDGRRNGEPFSTHISSDSNEDYTELMQFASKLDYDGCKFNGNVLDLMASPNFITDNFEKFTDFLEISASLGYFQMQMNVVDSKTLIEAKENPELHPNLIVRVWGFSAYFNDLPLEYKDVLIDRALRNEGKLAI